MHHQLSMLQKASPWRQISHGNRVGFCIFRVIDMASGKPWIQGDISQLIKLSPSSPSLLSLMLVLHRPGRVLTLYTSSQQPDSPNNGTGAQEDGALG